MNDGITLGRLDDAIFEIAKAMCETEFRHHLDPDLVKSRIKQADQSLSFGAFRSGILVGSYLVNKAPLFKDTAAYKPEFEFLRYASPLQGLALAVPRHERGQGIGRLLRATLPAFAKDLGADFVWGGALKSLGNMDDWKKRRAVLREYESYFISVEPLTLPLTVRLLDYATPSCQRRWVQRDVRAIAGEGVVAIDNVSSSRVWLLNEVDAVPMKIRASDISTIREYHGSNVMMTLGRDREISSINAIDRMQAPAMRMGA